MGAGSTRRGKKGRELTHQFAQRLLPWISQTRLEAHRPPQGDDLAMVCTYLHNIALCEALYTPLGFLEVALRNSLHTSLSSLHGSSAWYALAGVLEQDQQRDVARVSARIRGAGKPVTPDRVVSELSFGFWVALLSTPYDARFWRPQHARFLKASFPGIPRNQRQRPTIYKRYNQLRQLRNRVFHHETIWNRVTLSSDYRKLCEAIGWISPEMADACALVDRFDHVRQQGYAEIEIMLKQHLGIP